MSTVTVKLVCNDSRILDSAIRKITQLIPAEEYVSLAIATLPPEIEDFTCERYLVRKLTFCGPTKKFAGYIAKIDVPQNVEIRVR